MIFQYLAVEVIVPLVVVALINNPTTGRTIKACLLTTFLMTFILTRGDVSRLAIALFFGAIAFVISYAAARLIFHRRIREADATQTPRGPEAEASDDA